jgi:hypothetical protein
MVKGIAALAIAFVCVAHSEVRDRRSEVKGRSGNDHEAIGIDGLVVIGT